MPEIPSYNGRKIERGVEPPVYRNFRASPESFGLNKALQYQQLGSGLESLGNAVFRLGVQQAEIRARAEAREALSGARNDLIEITDDLLKRQGKASTTIYDELKNKMGDIQEKYQKQIGSQAGADLYKNAFLSIKDSYLSYVGRHQAANIVKYNRDTLLEDNYTTIQEAKLDPLNDNNLKTQAEAIKANIRAIYRPTGEGKPDAIEKAETLKAIDHFHAEIFNARAAIDPKKALEYYNKNKKEMPSISLSTIAQLKKEAKKQDIFSFVMGIKDLPYETQINEIQTKYKDDSDAYHDALQEIERNRIIKGIIAREALRKKEVEAINYVTDQINSGNYNPKIPIGLSSGTRKDLETYVKQLIKAKQGFPLETDYAQYAKWLEMSEERPQDFLKIPIPKMITKTTEDHFETLIKRRAAIRKGKKAGDVLTPSAIMTKIISEAGIKDKSIISDLMLSFSQKVRTENITDTRDLMRAGYEILALNDIDYELPMRPKNLENISGLKFKENYWYTEEDGEIIRAWDRNGNPLKYLPGEKATPESLLKRKKEELKRTKVKEEEINVELLKKQSESWFPNWNIAP